MTIGYEWMMGEIKSNLNTNVTLVNNTAKTQDITVPTGMRWYIFGGKVSNGDSVDRATYVRLQDGSANTILYLKSSATLAAGAEWNFPQHADNTSQIQGGSYPLPALAGWVIRFYWAAGGASAGGTSQVSLLVLEVPE